MQKKGKQGEAMEERKSFTAEELALAKSVDLTAVAASLGYTVKKIGRYHTLKEMDSIRIYNRTNWFRWSREHERGNNGGCLVNGASCFHLPLALAKAGKFYPSITNYGKNENFGNVFEKTLRIFFKA